MRLPEEVSKKREVTRVTFSINAPMIAGMTGPVALGDRLGVRWRALCPKLR